MNKKYHYVYRISELSTNREYIGVRSSNIKPYDDLGSKYFSSSTNRKFIEDQKLNPSNFKYKIIRTFESRDKANQFEQKLQAKLRVHTSDRFINIAVHSSSGFYVSADGWEFYYHPENNDLIRVKPGETPPPGFIKGYNLISITNGKSNKQIPPNSKIPNGWYEGRAKSENPTSVWINNSKTGEIKKIKSNQELPEGWEYGHGFKTNKGKIVYYDPVTLKNYYLNQDEKPESSWVKGRYHHNKPGPEYTGWVDNTKWFHDPVSKKNYRLHESDPMTNNLVKGRSSFNNKINDYYHFINLITREHHRVEKSTPTNEIPEYWANLNSKRIIRTHLPNGDYFDHYCPDYILDHLKKLGVKMNGTHNIRTAGTSKRTGITFEKIMFDDVIPDSLRWV